MYINGEIICRFMKGLTKHQLSSIVISVVERIVYIKGLRLSSVNIYIEYINITPIISSSVLFLIGSHIYCSLI